MSVRAWIRPRRALIAAALMWVAATSAGIQAQNVTDEQRQFEVQRALERLPGYGVFDFLAFSLDRGTVTLVGYAYNESLKTAATRAVKRIAGVDDVLDQVEVLPASFNDDRIRRATFYKIYTDSFLSRYASGGPRSAYREAIEFGRYPGQQPFGNYPIHIVVDGGRIRLLGAVDHASDRQLAEFRAREVGGVFAVANELVIARK
jgi:hyperosmotically inducible protein